MNRPNRLTVVAGAVGGLALVATAVGAVALNGGAPETPSSQATQSAAPLEPATTEPSDDRGSDDAGTSSAATGDEISRDQAVEIAEQAFADLGSVPTLDEVEREFEHGREVWKVEFDDDHEAYVDIATGDVVKLERDDDDHDDDPDDDHGDDRDDHGDDRDGDDDRHDD
ncbi:MAG TPA: PepSY domain-containing protein [Jiangellales bacterium]|nr:PepSY domain-containing protein [Jiangellales bacterium]